MKKYFLIVLLLVGVLVPLTTRAQTPQNILTPQARATLIVQLQAKLADLQQQLFILMRERQTPSVTITNPNLGGQRVIIFLVNYKDKDRRPYTKEDIYNLVLNRDNPLSTANFITENSYSKTYLEDNKDNIYDWHTLPITESEYCGVRASEYLIPYVDHLVEFKDRDKIVFLAPVNSYCHNLGGATNGYTPVLTDEGKFNLAFIGLTTEDLLTLSHYIRHEIGHTFGLPHANSWECGAVAIVRNQEDCEKIEYGDMFDTMGRPWFSNDIENYNVRFKEELGWLDSASILLLDESGIYTIYPIESTPHQIRGIKIPLTGELNYYLEYRSPKGDSARYKQGLFILLNKKQQLVGDSNVFLVDNTPHATSNGDNFLNSADEIDDVLDSALKEGQTFYDPYNNLTIKTLEVNDNYLKVEIKKG
jgi:hypothetical protein